MNYFTHEALLRRRSLLGALAFGAFSVFWTTMAFLLSHAPYHYNDLTIGLFGLVGAAFGRGCGGAGSAACGGVLRSGAAEGVLCFAG